MSVDSITFETYKSMIGELNRGEFEAVQQHSWTQDQYGEAFRYVSDAVSGIGLGSLPDQSDVDVAARLIGALGDRVPREVDGASPHKMWLLTEAYLLQGKDAALIMEASLRGMLGGGF